MSFIDEIKQRAKNNLKTIVLPEATDIRVLQATENILKDQFANVILVGEKDTILNISHESNINITGVKIVNPAKSDNYDKYVNDFFELRKKKGVTIDPETYFPRQHPRQVLADYMGLKKGEYNWRIYPHEDRMKVIANEI